MKRPTVTLIAAVAENGVIGRCGRLPWRIRADMEHFRAMTLTHPVIMGRKTFESLKKPLSGRLNIVVSGNSGFCAEGVDVSPSLDEAIDRAGKAAAAQGRNEIFVIGGGDLYRQAMARADRLCITHVAATPDGDAFFPPIDSDIWTPVESWPLEPSPGDDASGEVTIYGRSNDGER